MWILFVIFFQACILVHTNHPGNFPFSFYVPWTQFRGVDKGGGAGPGGAIAPYFGRIEGPAEQRWCAALLLAPLF